jgi:hypothetical protein
MEVYSAIALAMGRKRPRPPSPERDAEYMARDLMRRLEAARGPSTASNRADIDSLASKLYGADAPDVIARAGLEQVRRHRTDRSHDYFYAGTRAGGGLFYVKIRAGGVGGDRKGRPIGNDSSDTDGGVAAEGSVEGAA